MTNTAGPDRCRFGLIDALLLILVGALILVVGVLIGAQIAGSGNVTQTVSVPGSIQSATKGDQPAPQLRGSLNGKISDPAGDVVGATVKLYKESDGVAGLNTGSDTQVLVKSSPVTSDAQGDYALTWSDVLPSTAVKYYVYAEEGARDGSSEFSCSAGVDSCAQTVAVTLP